jgi:hypothetical protein
MANTTQINHAEYQRQIKTKSTIELHFIIKDCKEAIVAIPDGPKAGYYADEIHYCAMELRARQSK